MANTRLFSLHFGHSAEGSGEDLISLNVHELSKLVRDGSGGGRPSGPGQDVKVQSLFSQLQSLSFQAKISPSKSASSPPLKHP